MINYEKLWNEIEEVVRDEHPAMKQPHEKTFDDLMRGWRIGEQETKSAIEKLLLNGTLGSRKARSRNGKVATVYFPLES